MILILKIYRDLIRILIIKLYEETNTMYSHINMTFFKQKNNKISFKLFYVLSETYICKMYKLENDKFFLKCEFITDSLTNKVIDRRAPLLYILYRPLART